MCRFGERMAATSAAPAPRMTATSAGNGNPKRRSKRATDTPAAATIPGNSQRSHRSSAVDSIGGSSWKSIRKRLLPDSDAIGRCEVQLLSRLHAERLIPGVHVARYVRALLGWRVRIGQQPLPEVRLAIVAPPHLRPA